MFFPFSYVCLFSDTLFIFFHFLLLYLNVFLYFYLLYFPYKHTFSDFHNVSSFIYHFVFLQCNFFCISSHYHSICKSFHNSFILQSPTSTKYTPPRSRLFCTNCDSSETDVSNTEKPEENKPKARTKRSISEPDLSNNDTEDDDVFVHCLTSTPACVNLHACPEVLFTPEERGRRSMSPITRSTQRMCKAMQVMFFRYRKAGGSRTSVVSGLIFFKYFSFVFCTN